MAQATVNKYNWETRHTLTTHEHVQQLDDDRVVFWRRVCRYESANPVWEKVTIDRAAKTVTGEHLGLNNDGTTFVSGKSTMSAVEGSADKSHYNVDLWEV